MTVCAVEGGGRFASPAYYRRLLSAKAQLWRTTPRFASNWRTWALRRILMPRVRLRCWIRVGEIRFYLSDDPVDDLVLEGVCASLPDVYFPEVPGAAARSLCILDVGAHHGFYAVEALRRYPQSTIVAVEPDRTGAALVRKNLARNRLLHRAEVVEAGIGNGSGRARLQRSPAGSWGSYTVTDSGSQDGRLVSMLPLADLLRGRRPDLVKCNAEGAEYALVPQMLEMGCRPELVVLMAHPEYGSVPDLLAALRAAGYEITDVSRTERRPRFHARFHKACEPPPRR